MAPPKAPFFQFPGPSRSVPANGGLGLGEDVQGLLSVWGAGAAEGLSLACPGPPGQGAPGKEQGQAGSWAFHLPADLCSAER